MSYLIPVPPWSLLVLVKKRGGVREFCARRVFINVFHAGDEQVVIRHGVQQLVEGVIWVTFRHEAPLLKQAMTIAYLGFAYVLWPMYVPLSLGILERVRWRKRTLFAFLAAGIPVGLYLTHAIVTSTLVAEILGKHIVYVTPHRNLLIVGVLYVGATCLSCFFSSHGFLKLFGVLALLSLISAYLLHVRALVSLWCFFAAILSLLIYIHLRFRTLGGFPAEPSLSPATGRGAATG